MPKRLTHLLALLALASCTSTECVNGPDCGDGVGVATSVQISPSTISMSALGESQQLEATVLDQNGVALASAAVAWTSSDAAVVSVSATGEATAEAVGSAVITATSGTVSGTASATVTQMPVTLDLSIATVNLRGVGATVQIVVTATDANGNPIPQPSVTWSSSDPAIATVDSDGLVTGIAFGVAAVTAVAGGVSATATVTVEPFVPTADLVLDKVVAESAATYGDTITYAITITNHGPDEATNVMVVDSLPLSLTYVSHAASTGVYEIASGLWTVSAIPVDDTLELTLRAQVVGSGLITNSVSLVSADQADTVVANDVSAATDTVEPDSASASLAIGVDDTEPSVGDTVTFTLTFLSGGPDALPEAAVFDTLPTGLTWVSATPSAGTFLDSLWTIPAPAINDPVTLDLKASVDSAAVGQVLTHSVFVRGTPTHFDPVLSDDTASVSISVPFPALDITTTALANGAPTVTYDQTLTATGGDSDYDWVVTTGALPTGLSLDGPTGQIAGTPTGTSETFDVTVTSGDGQTDTQSLTITINPTLDITTLSLPNGAPTVAYDQTLAATGGNGANTWEVTTGQLPTGLTLTESTGQIAGTPTGTSETFDVTVTSGDGQTDTQSLTITINPTLDITTLSLPNGAPTVAYDQTLAATGGNGANTWEVTTGQLPTGLTLTESTGQIAGTPTGTSETFDVTVTNVDGQTDTQSLTITINPTLDITTLSLPNGAPTVAYDQTLAATGGNGANTWEVTTGQLPTGLTLTESTGQIAGTPTGTSETFDVTVTNVDGQTDTQSLTITINPTLDITTTSLPTGATNTAYSQTILTTGGDGNNDFAVVSGSLPSGLSLGSGTGVVSGTPGSTGTFNFTVRVSSGDGQTDTQSLQIVVHAQLLITTTSPLPNACCGGTYTFQLQATGGSGGYTWSRIFGSLPPNWTLSSTGLISGPEFDSNGPTYNFIVRVRSGDGQSDTQPLSVTFVIGEP